jgi:endonuclease/exonuclease/phosphatase family metal-dependent hydrolase
MTRYFAGRCFTDRWLLVVVFLWLALWDAPAHAQQDSEFHVVVCNIENLFDVDGVALFDDYKPEVYKPAHLLIKLQNHASILAKVNGGAGPDIILFQELEADQTPSSQKFDFLQFLTQYQDKKLSDMLSEPLTAEVKDLPSASFLLKALHEQGLGTYHVAVAEYRPDPTGRVVAHVNATFSRFPIKKIATHHTPGARGILEVVHDVQGSELFTFNNHWKSGASDATSERIREGNAAELKKRLEAVRNRDANADIILGGDFNSQHNQAEAYPEMRTTAVHGILGSQGDEQRIQTDADIVYNLWYELPESERGSDVYQNRWGTLMQMMVTRGLYDSHGIQYVDNSFEVLIHEGINAQIGSRVPVRWNQVGDTGGGFSDHFPVAAKFRVLGSTADRRFIELKNPSRGEPATQPNRWADFQAVRKANVPSLNEFKTDQEICDPKNLGHVYWVEGKISGERPLRIQIYEQDYNIWAFDVEMRKKIYEKLQLNQSVRFLGEVGIHEGKWQFIVRDLSWLEE